MTDPREKRSGVMGFFADGLDVPVTIGVSIVSIAIAVLETTHQIHLTDDVLRYATLGAFGAVALCLSVVMARQHRIFKQLEYITDQKALEHVRGMVSDVDPMLRDILGPSIDERVRNLESLLSRQTATVANPSAFLYFWTQTLFKYPEKKYCATSLARNSYFWKNDEAIKAMKAVLSPRPSGRRGKVRRIFLLDDEAELRSPEARAIMDRQAELGVTVRTMIAATYDKKLFLCAEDGSIAWEVFIEGSGTFREARVTTERARVMHHFQEFEHMWKTADEYSTGSVP